MPFKQTLLALATAWISVVPTSAGEPIQPVPPSALDWATTPEGVAFAPLIGDRFAEPYMAMVALPGGLVSPAHVKSADMYGVIVSGVMTHVALGDDGPQVHLPQGSFYRIPANVPHVSSCVSEEECVSFLYQDGAFDFVPVEE
ncbi:MAG: cupin domain-containing protein [Pseudomonadota bacterium]